MRNKLVLFLSFLLNASCESSELSKDSKMLFLIDKYEDSSRAYQNLADYHYKYSDKPIHIKGLGDVTANDIGKNDSFNYYKNMSIHYIKMADSLKVYYFNFEKQ